jgi:hypothetical protein
LTTRVSSCEFLPPPKDLIGKTSARRSVKPPVRNAISSKVCEKGLRDAFDSVIRGLGDAAKLENLPMLRFAAQIDLDLVDLLEGDLAPKR